MAGTVVAISVSDKGATVVGQLSGKVVVVGRSSEATLVGLVVGIGSGSTEVEVIVGTLV